MTAKQRPLTEGQERLLDRITHGWTLIGHHTGSYVIRNGDKQESVHRQAVAGLVTRDLVRGDGAWPTATYRIVQDRYLFIKPTPQNTEKKLDLPWGVYSTTSTDFTKDVKLVKRTFDRDSAETELRLIAQRRKLTLSTEDLWSGRW